MTITLAQERRLYTGGVELRDIETNSNLTMLAGRAVPYGVQEDIGWYLEEFAAGAFAKSISEAARGLPLLMFHDSRTWPIGVSHEWTEQTDGLRGVWKLDGSEEAQRAAQLAKPDDDGKAALGYMSVRFSPIRSEWTYVEDFNPELGAAHKDSVIRQESRLVEVSLVSTPAYKNATVEFVRTGERPLKREGQTSKAEAWRAELAKLRG